MFWMILIHEHECMMPIDYANPFPATLGCSYWVYHITNPSRVCLQAGDLFFISLFINPSWPIVASESPTVNKVKQTNLAMFCEATRKGHRL